MASVTFAIRIDEDVKRQSEAILSQMGLSVSIACGVFLRQVIRQGRIPFEIAIDSPTTTANPSMVDDVSQIESEDKQEEPSLFENFE